MNKYPRNHSIGLSKVANKKGDIGKLQASTLLLAINELHAGDLIKLEVGDNGFNTSIDFSVYRTYSLTLCADCVINVTGLDPYMEAFILINPKSFTCTLTGFKKESTEDTKPINMSLYKFYSPKPGNTELLHVYKNMYGIGLGEFHSGDFSDADFII